MTNTDLRDMTAVDLLLWIRRHRNDFPGGTEEHRQYGADDRRHDDWATLLVCLNAAGITDPDRVLHLPDHLGPRSRRQLYLLTRSGRRPVEPRLCADGSLRDLEQLPLVGWRVYDGDRDNAEEWAAVARRIVAHDKEWWANDSSHWQSGTDPADVIAAMLLAGRGPTYANELLDYAVRTGIPPTVYGFDLPATQFRDLAEAGIISAFHLDAYRHALTHDRLPPQPRPDEKTARAIGLAHDGVTAGAAVTAARAGVPYSTWTDRVGGFPESWFRLITESDRPHDGRKLDDPWIARDSATGKGFTLDQLRYLADHGWGKVDRYHLDSADINAGHRGGGRVTWTPETAIQLADAGMTPKDVSAYATAMCSGGSSSGSSRALVNFWPTSHELSLPYLRDAMRLHAAGVKASWITDYRWCGCRTVDDILTAAAAGIDGKRVKKLRDLHGKGGKYRSDPKHIDLFRHLLDFHRETPK